MAKKPKEISYRTVGEWRLKSKTSYKNPFINVTVDATFTSPSGEKFTVPGFYDGASHPEDAQHPKGEDTWRVRFNPNEVGRWKFNIFSKPADPALTQEGEFEVTSCEARGFLKATPGRAWGFHYESGEPVFFLGDTVYNLFGMAYCGGPVASFLKRRAQQGFNLLRVRLPVSPFHPPDGYNHWQTRRTWPWGGSEQSPQFDRFHLEYFHTVDQVVSEAEKLGLGFEMIMEAWGFEFPFNCRHLFLPEWEELWMRYLVARYDAFNCVYFWTLMNEYEYYPDGRWKRQSSPLADRWAMRMARWLKSTAQHGHIVSVHNGPQMPPFAERFATDPEAIDAIMFQSWGTTGKEDAWLASGIEESIAKSLKDWPGSALFAEYGYERNPEVSLRLPGHRFCDPEHTRRGAWRGAFSALGVIHGFENSWGPCMILDQDQPGLKYLLHMRRFFTGVVPFHRMRRTPEVLAAGEYAPGLQPLALATENQEVVAVYLPAGSSAHLALSEDKSYRAQWYDTRVGQLSPASPSAQEKKLSFATPGGQDKEQHPWDWVLVLFSNHAKKRSAGKR
ncbi:MAG: hypothetical protein AMS15_00020 [Planctomycetes bacterium DG_23]|nr:MAG: hypothetical protein AMS15_00020 [Planctomycetes bacterium DG_23]